MDLRSVELKKETVRDLVQQLSEVIEDNVKDKRLRYFAKFALNNVLMYVLEGIEEAE